MRTKILYIREFYTFLKFNLLKEIEIVMLKINEQTVEVKV
jgi:hypothetical protein